MMTASLLMLALVVGQAPAPADGLTSHRITYQGVTFSVRGTMLANGKIRWSPTLEANAAAYDRARREAESADAVAPPPTSIANYGLAPEKMKPGASYTAHSAEARAFIEQSHEPGSSPPRLHLTIIGSDVDRAAVLRDLAEDPRLTDLKPHLMVQDYQPGEWPVAESLGFGATNGTPTILVQTSKSAADPRGGKVIYRASSYPGPAALAEALRRADPHYRPDNDPGPKNNAEAPSGLEWPLNLVKAEHWPYVLGGLVLVVLAVSLLPRKEHP